MAVFAVVSSLQNHCLRAVACQLPEHETSLDILPLEIKTKLVNLLSKRGLLTDSNLAKVSVVSLTRNRPCTVVHTELVAENIIMIIFFLGKFFLYSMLRFPIHLLYIMFFF